jgi:hypothetical protein
MRACKHHPICLKRKTRKTAEEFAGHSMSIKITKMNLQSEKEEPRRVGEVVLENIKVMTKNPMEKHPQEVQGLSCTSSYKDEPAQAQVIAKCNG